MCVVLFLKKKCSRRLALTTRKCVRSRYQEIQLQRGLFKASDVVILVGTIRRQSNPGPFDYESRTPAFLVLLGAKQASLAPYYDSALHKVIFEKVPVTCLWFFWGFQNVFPSVLHPPYSTRRYWNRAIEDLTQPITKYEQRVPGSGLLEVVTSIIWQLVILYLNSEEKTAILDFRVEGIVFYIHKCTCLNLINWVK